MAELATLTANPSIQTLLPIYAIVLVVVGVIVCCILLIALVACRGQGTAKEKAVRLTERFKVYKPKKWGKATVSAPVNVVSSVDGNANYTATGGSALDRNGNPEFGMSSATTVARLRSDDPEMEMANADGQPLTTGLDEGNQAMVGNFHLTGKIDPNSTYGSPRTQNTATSYGQTAGAAHPNYQLQANPALSLLNTTGYNSNPTGLNIGYGQNAAGFGQTGGQNSNIYGQTNSTVLGNGYQQPSPRNNNYNSGTNYRGQNFY